VPLQDPAELGPRQPHLNPVESKTGDALIATIERIGATLIGVHGVLTGTEALRPGSGNH